MNQIFRRIKRIIKSNLSDTDSRFNLNNEDDELQKIIDSLNNDGTSKAESERKAYTPPPKTTDPKVFNAYKTLGLSEGASVESIKSSYKNLIKKYHPDRVSSLSKSEQEAAYKKSQEINMAYATLEKHLNF